MTEPQWLRGPAIASRARRKVCFSSGGTECAAWFYPGTNGGCVIMAGGFAVTKEPGTDLFAGRFNDAGFAVLAFDYRCFGWALNAESYPDWRREVAARSALRTGLYRPGRAAPRVRCPLLVVVCDQGRSALAEPAARAARRAPRGELVRLPGGHYAPFLGAHERAVQAELTFLRQNLLAA